MTKMSRIVLALLALVLAAPAVSTAQSQATTAEVNGRVSDTSGGVLPGVTVTVTNPTTGYTRSVVTNENGVFSLPLLPPGPYDLVSELQGFQTYKRSFQLTVGATLTINPQLTVGGVQEQITVVATVPVVETGATIRTTTIGENAIRNLPINGRRFQDFITLTPTVQVDTQRNQLSFAGQRGIYSNISVDGADYNQPFFGGIRGGERASTAFTLPQEAVQEFQVVAAGYSAEFGRSTGGLVNVITKSGSNANRGSAFYVNRHRKLAERNAFGQVAAPTQQQFGGSFGGPIKTDRIFYFGAIESQRFRNTRSVFFNTVSVTPNPDVLEGLNYFKSLEESFDATNDALAGIARVDIQGRSGSRLSLRYNGSRNVAENANAAGNALSDTTTSAVSNNGTERDQTHTFLAQYTAALSSNLLWETRGQLVREKRPRDANVQQPLLTGQVGSVGTVSFLGQNVQQDTRSQIASNLTMLKGTHSLKAGFEYNHIAASQLFGFDQFSTYSVNGPAATMLEIIGLGGANPNRFDVPVNAATLRRQIGNLSTAFDTDELAFFAQDAWKVTPTFTLNAGLRWEGVFNPTPQADNEIILNQLRGVTFPIGRTIDPTTIPNQLNQFAPRLGFAWDPGADGRTVVRGYTGLYYARTPGLILSDPMTNFRNPPGNLTVSLPFTNLPAGNPNTTLYRQLLLIGIDLNQYSLASLPAITPEQISQIAAALGLVQNPFLNGNVLAVDQDFRNPRAFQVGGGMEREIFPRLTTSADVIYVKTDFLQRNFDLNLSAPVPNPTDPARRPIYPTARPVPGLGQVQVRESTARSEYTALTLASRFERNWGALQANYVLSKSMSDDDNERDSGGVQFENGFNLEPEWSPARLDRRHQFNGFAMFFLPRGFSVSSGYKFQSGLPIDAGFGRDINNSRGGPDRPYSAPGVPFQRNAFRNFAYKEVNLRTQWGYDLADGKRVVLTAEFFNVFNWDNIQLSGSAVTNYCAGTAPLDCGFGPPTNPNFLSLRDNVQGSTTFGRLIQTNNPGPPRQIQLGVRFEF